MEFQIKTGIRILGMLLIYSGTCFSQDATRLPVSLPLLPDAGDLEVQRQQISDYFEARILTAQKNRDESWQPDFSSREAYEASLNHHRKNLRAMLGLIESDTKSGPAQVHKIAESNGARVERVTIPISEGLAARGVLFIPSNPGPKRAFIVCPDADVWPERLTGLDQEESTSPWLTTLLSQGSIVYVQQSIERLVDHPYCVKTRGKDRRAILYRLGYVVGRTMPGLDVQDTLAAVEFLAGHKEVDPAKISILGKGQGGMTALMSAALDKRISAASVVDYFDNRNQCWTEPVDRRLRNQLLEFGDAEVAALIAPRRLTIEVSSDFLKRATDFDSEVLRAKRFFDGLSVVHRLRVHHMSIVKGENNAAIDEVAGSFNFQFDKGQPQEIRNKHFEERLSWLRRQIDASEAKRYARWKILEKPAGQFPAIKKAMLKDYLKMVGVVPEDGTPGTVRSELVLTTEKYRAYRVTIDVVDGVSVYGNLLVPLKISGKRPAVICQHGFGGSPEKITGLEMKGDTAYHEYGRKLAEKGYVVFAPMLMHYSPSAKVTRQMRQANTVGMMRLAVPIAKTERVIDFLESLPYVDKTRIGYYGLSYGGYSAIWMTPLIERLSLSIVSGNFNDWRTKITSDELNTSYLRHPDEDMYSWNCLNRFTHPELIAMVSPRPVCIEFGRRDGITTPEWTAYAWKQTEQFRDHLGLEDRIVLEEFDGPHEIHGVETFDFLDNWLSPAQ